MKYRRKIELRAAIAEDLARQAAEGKISLRRRPRAEIVAALVDHMSLGNAKLPRPTAIFNPGGAAADCASRDLGYCAVAQYCYADNTERQYWRTALPYRRRQAALFDRARPEELAAAVLELHERFGVDTLRISESGDYRSQADLDKVAAASRILTANGIRVYCYTARRDLDYRDTGGMVVNGSGFRPHGGSGNTFVAVADPEAAAEAERAQGRKAIVCGGDCGACSVCTKEHGAAVFVRLH